jgi:hypothetical protein
MDGATPLTNMAAKNKIEREWVPSCFLVMHDRTVSTTIRYTPMHIQRADVAYFSTIKIYGRSPVNPVWSTESEALHLDSVFHVDSAKIAADLGVEKLLAYGEAFNWTPDMPPPTPNVAMPVHMHFSSTDGSMFGHLASFFIFGAPRSVQRGDFYYENFPGARLDADHHISAFVINPFVRPGRFRVIVVDADQGRWESPEISIKGKGVAEWTSIGSGCLQSKKPVGIIVKSDLKTSAFFATRTADGKMIGLDHGHPFLAQVLDHQ